MKTKTLTIKESRKALQTMFDDWYDDAPSVKGDIVSTIEYQAHSKDSWDSKKWGEFITLGTSFEGKKVIVKELPEMVGKSLWEVGEYIKQKGWTPVGHEYVEWLFEHQDAQEKPKDWQWWYCFGSLFRHSGGRWRVPYVYGDASGFGRDGGGLGDAWVDFRRVVLLETENLNTEPLKPLNFESIVAPLELRLKNLEEKLEKISEILK